MFWKDTPSFAFASDLLSSLVVSEFWDGLLQTTTSCSCTKYTNTNCTKLHECYRHIHFIFDKEWSKILYSFREQFRWEVFRCSAEWMWFVVSVQILRLSSLSTQLLAEIHLLHDLTLKENQECVLCGEGEGRHSQAEAIFHHSRFKTWEQSVTAKRKQSLPSLDLMNT